MCRLKIRQLLIARNSWSTLIAGPDPDDPRRQTSRPPVAGTGLFGSPVPVLLLVTSHRALRSFLEPSISISGEEQSCDSSSRLYEEGLPPHTQVIYNIGNTSALTKVCTKYMYMYSGLRHAFVFKTGCRLLAQA